MDETMSIPSPASIRRQLGIEDGDPDVFYAITLDESIAVAREIACDEMLPSRVRRILIVGLTLDLMPQDLSPRRSLLARRAGVSIRTARRHELEWIAIHPLMRTDLVHRGIRLLLVRRAASG